MKPARIIVLFIALGAGGIAVFLVGRSPDQTPPPAPAPVVQLETAEVLVANAEIGMGSLVSPQDLRWQTWPAAAAGASFLKKSDRPDAINQLAGSIARVPFSDGEPIREAKLIHANGSGYMAAILPTGMRAVSTDISAETGAGGFILPNDHVDVILTRRDHDAEQANGGIETHVSETILTNVRVLAIDQTVEEKGGQRVVVGKTATLELSSRLAEKLTLAHQLGSLSLALRSLVDSGKDQLGEGAAPAAGDTIVIYRGAVAEAYSCTPNCDHRVIAGGGSSDFKAPSPPAIEGSPAPARPSPGK
jgi:pilus assembly protein CpaB